MQRRTFETMMLSKNILFRSLAWQRYQAIRTLYYSTVMQNHYELLGIKRESSPEEIRESFIRLSKEYHPDTNPDSTELHTKFVAVNEAYSILSKPHLRQVYDAELADKERQNMYNYGGIKTNAPQERVIFHDDSLWEMRDRSEDKKYEHHPYYGIRGVKKLPNSYIAAGAVVFMIVGAIFHFFLAKKSSDFAIEQLNRRDQIASKNHMMAREQAKLNGNELQLTLLRQRIENANNSKEDVKQKS
ncbi:dnaJ-like protein 60 isoform X2 [Penaeus chinensis]|uniref:dnaJ-like protein 60 isoform X2 n=1 Tax=Penaeus chinensis TaxID=139456 RepID=UPI001FB7C201|nr:dnaJ-like protein 60 isoform X2 [Penaeus chinensis]